MMPPFVDSTGLLGDRDALARRLAEDGYLFLRGLIPPRDVAEVRARMLEVASEGGWLDRRHPVDEAIADPAAACVDPEPRYLEVFRRIYALEEAHALQHHPAVVSLFERLFGEPVLVHPRLVMRNIFPQRPEFTTPPHQDYPHIQGTTETFSCWIPLSDVPAAMGGLQVAPGSHKAGVRACRVTSGAGGMEVAESFEGRWVGGDFARGDVIVFHSLLVHRGSPNLSNRLRQSIDGRYQRASEPVIEASLRPYADLFTWEELYAGWRGLVPQYHWRRPGLKIVPFDMRYYEERDAMAFELAERGDAVARAALLRIVQRDPSEAKKARARAALERLAAAE